MLRLKSVFLFTIALIGGFLLSKNAFAQTPNLIKGILIDSASSRPVDFVTVTLLDGEKKTVALAYSDEKGAFQISTEQTGNFYLSFSFVGYRSKGLDVTITSDSKEINLGSIRFKSDITQLEAVTVTGTRQLIEQQPGMLIYNAQSDITNQGGSAADVLRKAPILNVDAAGNVTMRGNSNLRILINGKYSGQMARSPADALNMMPASLIKSIEIITSPSARYDAEGAAGIINIITKKGTQDVSGNIEAVIGNLEQALNPRIGVGRDKWNLNATLHMHRFRQKEITKHTRTFLENGSENGRLEQETVQDNSFPHGSGDVQIEYTPDSLNVFNFSMNGWFGNWPRNNEQQTRIYAPGGILQDAYGLQVKTDAPTFGGDFNLGYTRKLKKPGEELYLMAQHNRSKDHFDYDTFRNSTENVLTYREQNKNLTLNSEWTFQADYILPLSKTGKHALESGAKAIFRNVSSTYNVANGNLPSPNELIPNPQLSDKFDYRQDVAAAYSQLKLKWNGGWALHAGARLEGTFLEGSLSDQSTRFDNQFWNLVPTATFFKKINKDNSLTLSYTERISRPSIWDLNPNSFNQDPRNKEVGNPQLRPEKMQQVEFSYGLQTDKEFFLNTSLFWKNTGNSIESIVTTDNEGVATTMKQNLAGNEQYGVNFSVAVNVMSGWKINSNANVRHARFNSTALNIDHQGWAWGANLNSTWKLKNDFSIQAYGDYDASSVTLQGSRGEWLYYSFAIRKEIPSKKLTINLTSVSPFTSYLSRNEYIANESFQSHYSNRYLRRTIRLSLNWEFGNMFKQSKSRKIENNDMKNAKGNG